MYKIHFPTLFLCYLYSQTAKFTFHAFQVLLFTAVFCVSLIIFEVPTWIPHAPKFIKISCEVLIFLICETVIWMTIITLFDAFPWRPPSYNDVNATQSVPELLEYIIFAPCYLYLFLLGPVVNVLIHLLLIYHCIREASINYELSLFQFQFAIYLSIEPCL